MKIPTEVVSLKSASKKSQEGGGEAGPRRTAQFHPEGSLEHKLDCRVFPPQGKAAREMTSVFLYPQTLAKAHPGVQLYTSRYFGSLHLQEKWLH